MSQHAQQRIPGVYVRESADPHELDMLWAGSKTYHREDRSPLLFFFGGLMLGIIVTTAVFLLFIAKPNIQFGANELVNPGVEEVQEVTLPAEKDAVTTPVGKAKSDKRPIGGSKTYTVKSGDTLGGIAYRQYGSTDPQYVEKIRRANKLKGEMINIGDELVIPPKNYTSF